MQSSTPPTPSSTPPTPSSTPPILSSTIVADHAIAHLTSHLASLARRSPDLAALSRAADEVDAALDAFGAALERGLPRRDACARRAYLAGLALASVLAHYAPEDRKTADTVRRFRRTAQRVLDTFASMISSSDRALVARLEPPAMPPACVASA